MYTVRKFQTTGTKKSETYSKNILSAPLNIVFLHLGFWTFEKAWVCCEQI